MWSWTGYHEAYQNTMGKTCISQDNNIVLGLLLPQSFSWVQLSVQRQRTAMTTLMPQGTFCGFVLPEVPGTLGTLFSFSQFLWGFGGCWFFGLGWGVCFWLIGFLIESVSRSLVHSGAKMVLVVHFRRDEVFLVVVGFGFCFVLSVFKPMLETMPFIKEKHLPSNWEQKYRT